jgi:transposase
MEEGRLRSAPEALRRRFASEQPLRIAIEAGTHSPWVSRVLEECGQEVLVADARKLRLIYANKRKTDEVDALRTWGSPRAPRSEALVPAKAQGRREPGPSGLKIRSRQALVGCRTQLVNHVPKERSQVLRREVAQVPGQELPTRGERPSTSPRRFCRLWVPSWSRDRLTHRAHP